MANVFLNIQDLPSVEEAQGKEFIHKMLVGYSSGDLTLCSRIALSLVWLPLVFSKSY
jgi:hypothetical protein